MIEMQKQPLLLLEVCHAHPVASLFSMQSARIIILPEMQEALACTLGLCQLFG